MVFIDGVKYACDRCIRGHRVTSCQHTDAPLTMIKPKGRPTTQCAHCREHRKSKQLHTKCLCGSKNPPHATTCPCHMDPDLCTCARKKTGLRRTASNPPTAVPPVAAQAVATATAATPATDGPVRSASTTSLVSRRSSTMRGRTRSRNATVSSTTSTASTASTNSSVLTAPSMEHQPPMFDWQNFTKPHPNNPIPLEEPRTTPMAIPLDDTSSIEGSRPGSDYMAPFPLANTAMSSFTPTTTYSTPNYVSDQDMYAGGVVPIVESNPTSVPLSSKSSEIDLFGGFDFLDYTSPEAPPFYPSEDPSAEVAAAAAQLLPPEVMNMSFDYAKPPQNNQGN
ncbi:hypothetical protein TRICI_000437 [Trichomonascus ciferrii]|uniref:Copper-fist domain-containing protein n=1 Tax=Trichomonascus ciferrii TaxID=44093 RepID=A0A642VDF4_9ASCO|nr:hypothetical protein TRICI_000437 [Trichomonascus ciferrii]